MANRSKPRARRRMQIVMASFAILVVLSMMLSLVSAFSGSVVQPTPGAQQPLVITPTP